MKHFILEQSDTEIYNSHTGLTLVGLFISRYITLAKAVNEASSLHQASRIAI